MSPMLSSTELKEIFVNYARKSDSRLSIILGAGASRGYSRDRNYFFKPPVVSELFNNENGIVREIIEKPKHSNIKGQRAHIERSIRGFGGDLEAYLSDIYQNDKEDEMFPAVLQYLEEIFWLSSIRADLNDNFYQSLLNRVRDLRGSRLWSILTFNYDTLLEQSLASLPRFIPRRSFQTNENYTNLNPKVLKMHGSVNLRYITIQPPEAQAQPSAHEIFTNMMNDNRATENYLEISGISTDLPPFVGHRTYPEIGGRVIFDFPLMMIPVHTSTKTENSFFNRQIEQAKKELSESKLVVAIGYQFGDNTFIDALKELDLKESILILVGSKPLLMETINSKAYQEASKAWPKENIRMFSEDGFGSFVDALY